MDKYKKVKLPNILLCDGFLQNSKAIRYGMTSYLIEEIPILIRLQTQTSSCKEKEKKLLN